VREYVNKVFAAAGFLQYGATEELVGCIVMNLHPSVLAHTAFLDRRHTRKLLISAVGLIEETFSIIRERRKIQPELGPLSEITHAPVILRGTSCVKSGPANVGIVVGRAMLVGTVVDRSLSRETGPSPAVTRPPGVTYGCLNKVTVVPQPLCCGLVCMWRQEESPSWWILELNFLVYEPTWWNICT
jgi:hypothetical protein